MHQIILFVSTFIISGVIVGSILSTFDSFKKCCSVDSSTDSIPEFDLPTKKINWTKLLIYTINIALFSSFFICILERNKNKNSKKKILK